VEDISQDLLSPMISGVIAAIVAGLVTFFLTKSSQKKDRALHFHEHFFSRPLLEARAEAHKLLLSRKGKTLIDIYQSDDYKLLDPYWEIQEFFVRLNVAVKYGLVDKKIVADIFAQNFLFWWELIFREGLSSKEWAVEPEVSELHQFFKSFLPKEIYAKHIARARKELSSPDERNET
jgi:hypothetical protein